MGGAGLTGRAGRNTSIYTSDHMDYNSETGVTFVYGGEAGVRIVDQAGAGRQASYGGGSVVMFNNKTGEHHVTDIRGFQLVDPRSGVRAGIPPVPPDEVKAKVKKRTLPRARSGDKERRSFNGGSR